jgi:hypothetical protein
VRDYARRHAYILCRSGHRRHDPIPTNLPANSTNMTTAGPRSKPIYFFFLETLSTSWTVRPDGMFNGQQQAYRGIRSCNGHTWRQGLAELVSLGLVLDDQSVEVFRAADLELGLGGSSTALLAGDRLLNPGGWQPKRLSDAVSRRRICPCSLHLASFLRAISRKDLMSEISRGCQAEHVSIQAALSTNSRRRVGTKRRGETTL